MKNWTNRFVVLMVAGAIMCSALVVGCSHGDDADNNATTNNAAKPADNGTTP